MRSDRNLKKIYRQYNKEWFDSALPDVSVRWAVDDDDMKFECASKSFLACADNTAIVLNSEMKGATRLWRFTLLHEMVHTKLWPYRGHGKKFQMEMLRLAALGAFAMLW
jgi:predicted metal-dependent hydrolase